jgi:hypothetical protein
VKKRLSSFEEFELRDIGVLDANHQKTHHVAMNEPLIIYWDFKVKKFVGDIYFNAGIKTVDEETCIWVTSKGDKKIQFPILRPEEQCRIIIEIPEHHLMPGIYTPTIFIRSDKTGETFERIWSDCPFQVIGDGNQLAKGIVAVQANWTVKKLD